MVISRTPFRISFFGGGTDYKEYFETHGGSVLETAFNKFCYVTVRDYPPIFPFKNQFTYSKIERFNTPEEVSHPVVREFLKYMNEDGLQISYDADLPARSGIGSSSAFTVGLLNATNALRGRKSNPYSLANDAILIERELCRENGGFQDQIAVAYGGFNRIDFDSSGFYVKPVNVSPSILSQLNENLLLCYSGIRRFSYDISTDQRKNLPNNIDSLGEMKQLVDDAEKILVSSNSPDEIGLLLDHTWELKQKLSSKITNPIIDEIYEIAKKNGAIGGKLLGAGDGGFLLFYVPESNQNKVREALKKYMFVPFEFEQTGSQIVYRS